MSIVIEPANAPCGATIHGVNFAEEISPETVAEIRAAWLEHLVVAFPDQHLSLDRYEEVAQLFGDFGQDPYFKGLSDHVPIVGRIRARGLYEKGYTKIEQLKFVSADELGAIKQIGKVLAKDILLQVQ